MLNMGMPDMCPDANLIGRLTAPVGVIIVFACRPIFPPLVTIGLVWYTFAAYHWDCPFLYIILPLHYDALYYKACMTHAPVPADS